MQKLTKFKELFESSNADPHEKERRKSFNVLLNLSSTLDNENSNDKLNSR
jgi:hypothetical protein